MSRDYIAEVRRHIDQRTKKEYVAGAVAVELVAYLRTNDPKLLDGFLRDMAVSIFREFIGEIARTTRSNARRRDRTAFREAVTKGESLPMSDRKTLLAPWAHVTYDIDPQHTKVRLLEMTRAQLLYASSDYRERAEANSFEARFLAALARRVTHGVVGDHFTPEQIEMFRRDLTARTA